MEKHTRRSFLAAGSAGVSIPCLAAHNTNARIFVLTDASDSTVTEPPVRWATGELARVLRDKGMDTRVQSNLEGFDQVAKPIVIAPAQSAVARQIAGQASVALPSRSESLAVLSGRFRDRSVLLITGSDARGLVYGILEVADRLQHAEDPLNTNVKVVEAPANEIRSVARLFVSDIEDKPWFYNKAFWADYLTMLASQRFNRFSLTLGLGYDLPRGVLDSYFIFAYPFLLPHVPGYNVGVNPVLPRGEVERNLAALQWISTEANRRGLHFQLGLWSHTYEWIDSPKANYTITGLDARNHAAYCRDALRLLLQSCPAIDGITFRAHSESGIKDGSYEFWQTVFRGVADCGRAVEMDLHSKGIEFRQIQMALDTGQPVRISCKYAAEHMGLPGHQIAIRELERSRPSSTPQDRSPTRYGYADYLRDDRPYGVYFRMWPGKDKVVLWGDPTLISGYSRYSSFCGSLGLELCEPLSFKARQGSGSYPDRRIYADQSLVPAGGDWQKYLYHYRLWGRYLYDPDARPDSYRRHLKAEFQAAAPMIESGLGNASRVIPLVTSAHLPSAAGMSYWPEMYTNMPIVDMTLRHPYGDTPSPKDFCHVSPLDPGTFSSIAEYVEESLNAASGRYSPADVAAWLESAANTAEDEMRKARSAVRDPSEPSFRRVETDTLLQARLGRFFAEKMRAGIAYTMYLTNKDKATIQEAMRHYRAARDAWKGIIEVTKGVYVNDLAFGDPPYRRGHWSDRLAAIEQDLAAMERVARQQQNGAERPPNVTALLRPKAARPACRHTALEQFTPGKPLTIRINAARPVEIVRLHYRHVNQAEPYVVETMKREGADWGFTIPAAYTDAAFPLLYYFTIHAPGNNAWLYPGLNGDLANQSYFVVRRIAL